MSLTFGRLTKGHQGHSPNLWWVIPVKGLDKSCIFVII